MSRIGDAVFAVWAQRRRPLWRMHSSLPVGSDAATGGHAGNFERTDGCARKAALRRVTLGRATVLSLKDAQALALKNNPQISVARLTALASQQVTREVRSNLWPTALVDLTAVDAESRHTHHGRSAEQSHRLPARRRRRDGQLNCSPISDARPT